VRAISVCALAVLGATPLLRCSHLALNRKGGASVALAIVVDDSLSMRAPLEGGQARFERALTAARQLTEGLAQGDAAAVVLAGAPPRVAVASTTNLAAVAEALAGVTPSDRATDLDGAIALGRELLEGLPQADKRVVVLSDMADGNPDAPPIAGAGDIAAWIPVPELEASGADCGVVRADRSGQRARVRVACTAPAKGDGSAWAGRSLEIRAGDKVLGQATLDAPFNAGGERGAPNPVEGDRERGSPTRVEGDRERGSPTHVEDLTVDLPAEVPEVLAAALTGADAIAEDDRAPVISAGGPLAVAVVVDATATHVATGGPPPIEQALSALELDAQIHPLPAVPEHADDLAAHAGLIVDDAPGFTPEVRRSLTAWVDRGGVALLTLGPRAAAAPLGASFDPLVPGVVRWGPSPAPGIDPASAPTIGPSAEGLEGLAPRGRAALDPQATDGADVLARWKDGAPFLVRRSIGRGAVLILTLPLSAEESDVVLRPAFLALLDRFVATARARGGARRIDAGETWTFDGYREMKVERVSYAGPGEPEPVQVAEVERRFRASPALAGLYELTLDGERATRAVSVPEREIDLRPRRVHESARSAELGGMSASIDASQYVALGLLLLLAAELLLRTLGARRERAGAEA
jgi:hypothetical protein